MSHRRPGTVADWLAADDDERLELIDGELVAKDVGSFARGSALAATAAALGAPFHRRAGGPSGPGGWWLGCSVDILVGADGLCPDLAGWRRDRVAVMPRDRPVTLTPDWICEIVSESNRGHDTITRLVRYHQAGVPHTWILDQLDRTLTVHRHGPDGYVIVLRAGADERVRAEPFDAIELPVAVLLGDDPDDP